MEHALKFSYNIKINSHSNVFAGGFFRNTLPGCTEMVISSEVFDKYSDCEKSFTGVLSLLCATSTQSSSKNHIIVSKSNPLHNPDLTDNGETWEKAVVMLAYVASAEELKSKEIDPQIVGQIKVDEGSIELIKSVFNPIRQ